MWWRRWWHVAPVAVGGVGSVGGVGGVGGVGTGIYLSRQRCHSGQLLLLALAVLLGGGGHLIGSSPVLMVRQGVRVELRRGREARLVLGCVA